VTRLRHGGAGVFNNPFIVNLLLNVAVKECRKLVDV